MVTQKRINKTIEKLKTLHGFNKNTKINAIFEDTNNGDLLIFTSTRKINTYSQRMATFKEYITFNSRYVWGLRVSYFCEIREEVKRFEDIEHYKRIK